MGCKGLHCDGCGHGGGPSAAVIALVVIVALALHKAWPAIVTGLEIAAWTLASVCGAALAITVTVLAVPAARRHRARRAALYRPGRLSPPFAWWPSTSIRPLSARRSPAPRPAWPLAGWWEEISPQAGGDHHDHP